MNNIHDMRRRRGEIWDRAKAFLGEHQDENGMLSAEDTARYERERDHLAGVMATFTDAPPATLHMWGMVTVRARAVATAASTAVPPSSMI